MNKAVQTLRNVVPCVMLVALSGCGGGGSSGDDGNNGGGTGDSVSIVSASPAGGSAGVLTTYTVKVAYHLESAGEGELMVGFNDDQMDPEFIIKDSAVVEAGDGEQTFVVDTTPIVRTDGAPFAAYANISPYPHGDAWQPLAEDAVEIGVDARAVAGTFSADRAEAQRRCDADPSALVRCAPAAE